MEFFWPTALAGLVLVPLFVAAYLWLLSRRRRYAVRYASLSLVREALGKTPSWRRHVPPALLLFALGLMIVGFARPYTTVTVPSQEGTVILAMDVSGSMLADDIKPSRIEVSKSAAKAFVAKQGEHVKIGVVAFAADASIVQSPTLDKDLVIQAIDRLRTQRATAIGRGILISLDAIFENSEDELPSVKWLRPDLARQFEPAQTAAPRIPGSIPKAAATIVLLTDGQNNQYPPPLTIIDEAIDRGVRVYTIGFGTAAGTVLRLGGRGVRVGLDEDVLKQVAKLTDAEYFNATNEQELRSVYENLSTELVFRKEKTEVTALFTGAAALVTVLAAALSLAWFGRVT
jgi:Ca-activated chloride channel homolog